MNLGEMVGFGWILIVIGIWICTGFGTALIAGGVMLFIFALFGLTAGVFNNGCDCEDEEDNV